MAGFSLGILGYGHFGSFLHKLAERFLPDVSVQQRSVLSLVILEGMSYDEVAKIVNAPIGTVRSRLFRARESLRTVCPDDADMDQESETATDAPYLRQVK